MFSNVPAYAGDPILSLLETYRADQRAHKVNLGVGMYYDERGEVPVLPVVKAAEAQIQAAGGPRVYLPMEGNAQFRAVAVAMGRNPRCDTVARAFAVVRHGLSGVRA